MDKKFDYQLKDYLNDINLKTGKLTGDEDAMKKYPAYVINKCMSHHVDTVLYANEMNRFFTLDNDLQYQFYIHSIRKSKRFAPWDKQQTDNDLERVKQFYGYSTDKARDALKLLNKGQLEVIKSKLKVGGKNE